MFKKLVLNYIRTHMSHETSSTRREIFTAINEGMTGAFHEDNLQGRLSYGVTELLRGNEQFMQSILADNVNPYVDAAISGSVDEVLGKKHY